MAAGLATSIFGVLESVRICPNPSLYRIRPNPEPISVGSKRPYRLYNTAKKCPAGLLGIRPNPSESDPPPNPSESRTAIPAWRANSGSTPANACQTKLVLARGGIKLS